MRGKIEQTALVSGSLAGPLGKTGAIVHTEATEILSFDERPRLRPVSVQAHRDGTETWLVITDPTMLAPSALTVSEPALFILSLLDGEHSLRQVSDEFRDRYRQPVADETLVRLVGYLRQAHLLNGPEFESYYAGLVDVYRAHPARLLRDAAAFGTAEQIKHEFDEVLAENCTMDGHDGLVGIIAPHLDYPRGRPCYGAAYGALSNRRRPDRVVILGTNHFGRSAAICATGKDFQTPLGVTPCDTGFLDRLEARCGSLRTHELDHAREHSIELQVLWLQHLFGAESFHMLAVLCPDPCGLTGTAPSDGQGVDLREFAVELGRLIREEGADTLVVAGADLSHVGRFFGQSVELSDELLAAVDRHDNTALGFVERLQPEGLREFIASSNNSTSICSAGCIYALLTALEPSKAEKLAYHQAVTREIDNCVTCAAFALYR